MSDFKSPEDQAVVARKVAWKLHSRRAALMNVGVHTVSQAPVDICKCAKVERIIIIDWVWPPSMNAREDFSILLVKAKACDVCVPRTATGSAAPEPSGSPSAIDYISSRTG